MSEPPRLLLHPLLNTLDLFAIQLQSYIDQLDNSYELARLDLIGLLPSVAQLRTETQEAIERHSLSGPVGSTSKIRLSARERQVLALVVIGLPNKAIAAQLGCTPRTIQHHLHNLFRKTGSRSRTALAALALLHDWIAS